MSWVLRHSPTKLGQRLVLLVIADHASETGTQSWCSVDTIAEEARLTRRAVQYALRRLEADGAIIETGKGPAGTHEYAVLMGAQNLHGAQTQGGRKTLPQGGASVAPKPSIDQPPNREGPSERTWRVDGKLVTDDELEVSQSVLAEWNQQAEQRLQSREWLAKIVMRIREHPELGVAEHAHIIRVSLAHPWWRSTPSPSVIYGNGAQFERQLTEAAKATEGGSAGAFKIALDAIRRARGEAS
jgi:hypothetical protein